MLRQFTDVERVAPVPQHPAGGAASELGDLKQHVEPRFAVHALQRFDAAESLADSEAAGRRVVRAHDLFGLTANEVGEVHQ